MSFEALLESYQPRKNTAEFQKTQHVQGNSKGIVAYKQLMALSNLIDAQSDQLALDGDAALASRMREFSSLVRNEANKKKNT